MSVVKLVELSPGGASPRSNLEYKFINFEARENYSSLHNLLFANYKRVPSTIQMIATASKCLPANWITNRHLPWHEGARSIESYVHERRHMAIA